MMPSWRNWRRAFQLPLTRGRLARDVDEELRFHLEERIEELVAMGLTRNEAEDEALRRLGNVEEYRRRLRAIDEETRGMRARREIGDTIRRETRHAMRTLLRTPAFSLMSLATLALGIGATTAIFTVLDAVVLRPLPYPDAERLVELSSPVPGIKAAPRWGLARHEMYYFQRSSRTIEEIAIFRTFMATVGGDGETHQAERVGTAQVSASVFGVLGIAPAMGRLFNIEDNRREGIQVALLGHDFWMRRFGGDPAIVGKRIVIEGSPATIVGVLRPGAQLPATTVGLWLPQYMPPEAPAISNHVFDAVARLRPGVSVDAAQHELKELTARFPEAFPNVYQPRMMQNTGFTTEVRPLRDVIVGEMVTKALWILFGAVAVVLLIAAANVANLFLVRSEARRREVALRTALGADRMQLSGHFLAESLMLATVAAVAAVAVAWVGLRSLIALAPSDLPRVEAIHLGARGVVFAVGTAIAAGLALGTIPLIRAGSDLRILREGGRGATSSRRRLTARNALVVGQFALALILLAASGLMVRSLRNLRSVDAGFDAHGVLTMSVSLPYARYNSFDRTSAFYEQLASRVHALPGVTAVGFGTSLPLETTELCTAVVVDVPGKSGVRSDCLQTLFASPGYFEALRIPIEGRAPDWAETNQRGAGAVVSSALAERFWPDESAIGRGIKCCNGKPPFFRITGVTGAVRTHGMDRSPGQVVYFPLLPLANTATEGVPTYMRMVVRSTSENMTPLVPAIRRLVAELDPQVPVSNAESMESLLAKSLARRSFTMLLLGIAAGMALLLSAVGLYGVVSYVVAQRRGEIGIRMALGAPAARVRAMVVRQSVTLAAIGAVIGLAGALATTRLLGTLLFGVSPTDPLVLAGAAVLLGGIALVASYAPARRASRVDPAEALRAD